MFVLRRLTDDRKFQSYKLDANELLNSIKRVVQELIKLTQKNGRDQTKRTFEDIVNFATC